MNENNQFKKYGADKIAFLGMFILAVFIARFLVSSKSGLEFSEPVELTHASLSVSMPTGKYWQSVEQWVYDDDAFVLSSKLITNPMATKQLYPDAAVYCKYFLKTRFISPKSLIRKRLGDIEENKIVTNRIQKDNLTINWARVNEPLSIIEAVIDLPDNRVFVVEIVETSIVLDLAQEILQHVIDSLSFEEDNLVKTGANFITDIKSKGIDSLIDSSNVVSCFFYKNDEKKNVGYTIDMLGFLNSDRDFKIRGASDFVGSNGQHYKTLFRCDEPLDNFIWEGQTNTIALRQTGQIFSNNETGTIVFKDHEMITVSQKGTGKTRIHLNCSNVVPSILLESLIRPAIRSDINEAVIDVVNSSGEITPTLLSIQVADKPREGYSYIVTLESLDGNNSPEKFYLDRSLRIIKGDGIYSLERTDLDKIEEEYPGTTGDIKEQLKLLDSYAI